MPSQWFLIITLAFKFHSAVWCCRHCGDSVFDGCCLNRNGSNAQLFVFKVGSRIWQSDAKSHRILILLLPPPPPSSVRAPVLALVVLGCLKQDELRWGSEIDRRWTLFLRPQKEWPSDRERLEWHKRLISNPFGSKMVPHCITTSAFNDNSTASGVI